MEQDLTASEKIEPLKDVPSFLNWSSDSRRLDKQSRCSTLLSKVCKEASHEKKVHADMLIPSFRINHHSSVQIHDTQLQRSLHFSTESCMKVTTNGEVVLLPGTWNVLIQCTCFEFACWEDLLQADTEGMAILDIHKQVGLLTF